MVGQLMAEGHPGVAIDPLAFVRWHQAYDGHTILHWLPVFEFSSQYTYPL
mgnify:CR=1 FL=1